MLEGWPLWTTVAVATLLTIAFGRARFWAWGLLGALLMLLGIYDLGVAALFFAAILLAWRVANPPQDQPPM